MDKVILIVVLFFSLFAWGVPKEQDRAILEGEERNLLKNPGYEARRSGVTASGGVVALETADPLDGKISLTWDSSASAQTLESPLFAVTKGMQGATCGIFVKYLWEAGVADDLKLVAHDGSDPIAEVNLNPTSGTRIVTGINFTCPSSGSLKWRLESTVSNPAIITLDTRFLGSGRNTQQIAQTILIAATEYVGAGGCVPGVTGVYADFPSLAACGAPIVRFSTVVVSAADNDEQDLDIPDLPSGTYKITFRASAGTSSSGVQIGLRVSDGTTVGERCGGRNITSDNQGIWQFTCSMTITYSSAAARRFRIQGTASSGTISLRNDLTTTSVGWEIWKVPTTSAEAITLETIGGVLEAKHSVDCGWEQTTVGSFTDFPIDSSCTFSFEPTNSFKNIVSLDDGTPGNNFPGIKFDALKNATAWVCALPTGVLNRNISGITNLRLFNNTQSKEIAQVDHRASVAGTNDIKSKMLCGFTKIVVGTNELEIDAILVASASGGGMLSISSSHAIQWYIFDLTNQKPTPIFTDLINSLNTKVESSSNKTNLHSCSIVLTAGVPSLGTATDMCAAWIDSITDTAIGVWGLNFTSGIFVTNEPVCVAIALDTTSAVFLVAEGINTSSLAVRMFNTAGAGVDLSFNVTCHGKLP